MNSPRDQHNRPKINNLSNLCHHAKGLRLARPKAQKISSNRRIAREYLRIFLLESINEELSAEMILLLDMLLLMLLYALDEI